MSESLTSPLPQPPSPVPPTDTRERIIHAAAGLIHKQGFRSTTIDDVLAASGVKKGNLYYYFSSKGDLGLAVLDFMHESHLASVRQFLQNDALSPRERVNQWLTSMLGRVADAHCAYGCPFGNLALEMSDACEIFRGRIAAHFDAWQDLIAQVVREGQGSGDFAAVMDADEFAAAAVTLLEGAILMAKLKRELAPVEFAVTELRRRLDSPAAQVA